jgi:hypothetical protein
VVFVLLNDDPNDYLLLITVELIELIIFIFFLPGKCMTSPVTAVALVLIRAQ